jgi:hypothetical protein
MAQVKNLWITRCAAGVPGRIKFHGRLYKLYIIRHTTRYPLRDSNHRFKLLILVTGVLNFSYSQLLVLSMYAGWLILEATNNIYLAAGGCCNRCDP